MALAAASHATIEEEAELETEMKKVTIAMPVWMFDDLRRRAKSRGITVTELMRRAVALERMLFSNPDNEVILRSPDRETDVLIQPY